MGGEINLRPKMMIRQAISCIKTSNQIGLSEAGKMIKDGMTAPQKQAQMAERVIKV